MAILQRLLPSLPSSSSRRAYSFFSSKSGGGKYFTPSKTPKVAAVAKPTSASPPAPNKPSPPNSPDARAQAQPTTTDGPSIFSAPEAEPYVTPSQAMAAAFGAHAPRYHPTPTYSTLQLHNFFALERPMLLLSQPTSALFEPAPQVQAQGPEDLAAALDYPEADVDAARLLARSLVMQRVGSTVEWSDVMAKLGAKDELVVELDSVKRKRRKKMNKHRYKKRRKLQRAERRRLKK